MFKLEIKTANAAFREDDDADYAYGGIGDACRAEVARILRQLAKDIENGRDAGAVFDANGNRVGSYELSE